MKKLVVVMIIAVSVLFVFSAVSLADDDNIREEKVFPLIIERAESRLGYARAEKKKFESEIISLGSCLSEKRKEFLSRSINLLGDIVNDGERKLEKAKFPETKNDDVIENLNLVADRVQVSALLLFKISEELDKVRKETKKDVSKEKKTKLTF